MTRTVTLLLIAGTFVATLRAQSTAGTEFWLGYMENLNIAFNDPPAFSIIINADGAAMGSIDVPGTGLSIPFSVGAGTTEVFLPTAIYYSEESEQIEDKGLRVTADAPIRVQAIHYRLYFAESTNLLPVGELGADYRVTAMLDEGGLQPSSLVIVATEDNTEIEITPAALTLGLRPANVPFTITLDEGQLYQIQSLGDLTGTRVRSLSGAPIAVFGGAQQANITDGFCPGGADSHVWDQTLPLDDWRDLYYFVPFLGQGGDRIRILAANDNTRVFFDCEQVATLDEGEFYEGFLDVPTVISSTEVVSLTQYNNGFSCEPSQIGDPNGLSYLPADFRGTNFRWFSSDRPNAAAQSGRHFDRHFITIVAPSDATAGVVLDGAAVNTFEAFTADPEWEYARVEVTGGNHQLVAAEAVQVYSYGFGFADAYTNHLGYTQSTPEEFACLDIEREGVLCVDSLQQFTYTSNLDLVSFDWNFGDGNSSTEPEPSHTYSQPGTYEVVLTATDANGLVLSASLEFTVEDCSDNPCSPDNVMLDIDVDGNGCVLFLQTFTALIDFDPVLILWDFGDGTTATGLEQVQHFYEMIGTYTVTVTMTNDLGCVFTENIHVDIENCDPCPDDPILTLSTEGDLCVGNPIDFSSSYLAVGIPTFELQWAFSDGQVAIELNPTVTFDTPGEYSVDLFILNAFGCLYQGSLTFTIDACDNPCADLPPIDIAGPLQVCIGEPYLYNPVTTAELVSYSWTTTGANGNDPTFLVTFQEEGFTDLQLQATDAQRCDYEANIVVEVIPCTDECDDLILEGVNVDGALCQDSTFTFTAVFQTIEPAIVSWIYFSPIQQEVFGAILTQDNFPEPGDYEISLQVVQPGTDCLVDTLLSITIEECTGDCSTFILEDLSISGDACVDSVLTLTPSFSTIPDNLVWTLPDQSIVSDNPLEITFLELGPQTIGLQAFWNNGCSIDTSVELDIQDCIPPPDCELMLPNIFSPNSDGVNDNFRAFFADECTPTTFTLEVYNRWGGQVYQSNDPNESWDGRFLGKPHSSDVLIYWCQATFPGGEVVEKKGDITLIR